jgi:ribosomal protein L20A (L18A)
MRNSLKFEDKSTKELISKLYFEFFLNQNIKKENYSIESVSEIKEEFELCHKGS